MARIDHGAVFFTGRTPHTTKEYARVAWQQLVDNGAKEIIFVDHIETLGVMMRHTRGKTFFIHGVPFEEGHLQLLEEFERKAIVHLNFEPRSNRQNESGIGSVLAKAQGVHVIQVADGRETHDKRMDRIFRGLGKVHPALISPSITKKVLLASGAFPTPFARALVPA